MHSLTLLCWGLRKKDVAFPLRLCQQTHHLNLESCGVVTTYFLTPLRAVVTSDQMSCHHLRKRDVKVRRPWWYQLKRSAVATLLTWNQINVLKMISYISTVTLTSVISDAMKRRWCYHDVLNSVYWIRTIALKLKGRKYRDEMKTEVQMQAKWDVKSSVAFHFNKPDDKLR